jgi:hypothetical protein
MKETKILMLTTVLVFLFVTVGTTLAALLKNDYPIILTIIATGVATFFGFLIHPIRANPKAGIDDSSMRIAITASLVITYLVFVGYTAFYDASSSDNSGDDVSYNDDSGDGASSDDVSEMARIAITSFTTIVGTVIAFYFGASAYLQAKSTGLAQAQHENNSEQAT